MLPHLLSEIGSSIELWPKCRRLWTILVLLLCIALPYLHDYAELLSFLSFLILFIYLCFCFLLEFGVLWKRKRGRWGGGGCYIMESWNCGAYLGHWKLIGLCGMLRDWSLHQNTGLRICTLRPHFLNHCFVGDQITRLGWLSGSQNSPMHLSGP